MKIVIASGKGGTGKTTVSLNLALALSDVQLFDCDVEEPNCNLFLGFELDNSRCHCFPDIQKSPVKLRITLSFCLFDHSK